MTQPPRMYETRIKPEWIDEYGHMNVAHYITVCDQATYAYWCHLNDGRQLDDRGGHEYAILEAHVNYLAEVVEGDPVTVTTQLLSHDDKRFILFHRMWRVEDGALSATNEVKALGFNLNDRRAEAFTDEVRERLARDQAEHDGFGAPDEAGKGIALKRV